jgi:hypothetical protein
VTLLDCGNRSNMYAVARAIRPFTADPVGVMKQNSPLTAPLPATKCWQCWKPFGRPPREPLVILDLLAPSWTKT